MNQRKMKIISIIPVRGGSKEILNKNLVPLNEKPLLYYTVSASKNSKLIDRTIVSTDNEKIMNLAKKHGAEVIKRPKKLSDDKAQLELVMEHVIKVLKRNKNYFPDILVLLQNTSPLRTATHIDEALDFFFTKKYDSLLSGFKSHRFFWKMKADRVFPFNYNPKKRSRRQEISNQFIENGAIYITKLSSFKKSKCRISGKIGLYVMPEEISIEIDSKFELSLANLILKNQKR